MGMGRRRAFSHGRGSKIVNISTAQSAAGRRQGGDRRGLGEAAAAPSKHWGSSTRAVSWHAQAAQCLALSPPLPEWMMDDGWTVADGMVDYGMGEDKGRDPQKAKRA